MKVILVDDEEVALDILEITCKEVGGLDIIGKYNNPFDVIEAVQNKAVDILFLDIEMPGINGLELAEKVMIQNHTVHVVFVTAYNEYAVEAFEINALDYLLKPVRKERLEKTIKRIQQTKVEEKETQQQSENRAGRTSVCCLGSFIFYDQNKKPVKWRTRKTKELFAYLWHHRSQWVHRDQIIIDLWPDAEGDRMYSLLHTTVYHLRNTLKKIGFTQPVPFLDERYTLHVDGMESDVEKVGKWVQNTTNQTSEASWERMLTLYKGDYMEHEDFPWSSSYRQHIRELYMQRLELGVDFLQTNTIKEKLLQQLFLMNPYLDKYCYSLMDHYLTTSNASKAIAVYDEFKRKLMEDLGEEPEENTTKLYLYAIHRSK